MREIKEEYNLDTVLDQCSYLMDYHDGADKVYLCHVDNNQEPKIGEGLSMKWMTINEIEKLEIGFHQEGIIPVLKNIVMKFEKE